MKLPLTIQIIVKNDEDKIEQTLQSISGLNAHILIGDIGCADKSIEICEKYDTEIVRISLNNDFSKARNYLSDLSKNNWQFYIHPGEVIFYGIDNIKNILNKSSAYKINIVQDDLINKSTRIWNKKTGLKFKNPVFETLYGDYKSEYLDIYLTGSSQEYEFSILKKWKENSPFNNEVLYYLSIYYLKNKDWSNFLNLAELYLYQEKKESISTIMTKYYYSMTCCYLNKDYQKAAKFLLPCLIKQPTMAEFWCLLADIYYQSQDYKRAICFYENAVLVGKKRLKHDDWPIEISKYKDYPTEMIKNCKKIIDSYKILVAD